VCVCVHMQRGHSFISFSSNCCALLVNVVFLTTWRSRSLSLSLACAFSFYLWCRLCAFLCIICYFNFSSSFHLLVCVVCTISFAHKHFNIFILQPRSFLADSRFSLSRRLHFIVLEASASYHHTKNYYFNASHSVVVKTR
jgi:hypothetical protein